MSLKHANEARQPTNISCAAFFTVVLFLLAGLLFIYWGTNEINVSRASLNWPSVTGKVVRVDIFHEEGEDYDYYTPYITYQYVVNDETYQSRRVRISGDMTYHDEYSALQDSGRYPLHSQVIVYYDPNQPERALLERQASGHGKLITGIVFASAGIIAVPIMTWYGRRQYSKRKTLREWNSQA